MEGTCFREAGVGVVVEWLLQCLVSQRVVVVELWEAGSSIARDPNPSNTTTILDDRKHMKLLTSTTLGKALLGCILIKLR